MAWLHGRSILAPIAAGIAIFAIIGTLTEVLTRAWRPGLAPGMALRRAAGPAAVVLGRGARPYRCRHDPARPAGVGFGAEVITTLHQGVPQTVGPYEITLDSSQSARRAEL